MSRHGAFLIAFLLVLVCGLGYEVYRLGRRHASKDMSLVVGGKRRRMSASEVEGLVRSLEQERDRARARVKELEKEAVPLPAEAVDPVEEPQPHMLKAVETAAEKKARVKKVLEGMNWKRIAKGLIAVLSADERSRREGKALDSGSPEVQQLVTENFASISELQRLLGLKSCWDVPLNPGIAPYFLEGWAEAMGVTLTPEQLAKLQGIAVASEKQIGQRVTLPPGQQQRLGAGSGNLLQLKR